MNETRPSEETPLTPKEREAIIAWAQGVYDRAGELLKPDRDVLKAMQQLKRHLRRFERATEGAARFAEATQALSAEPRPHDGALDTTARLANMAADDLVGAVDDQYGYGTAAMVRGEEGE